MGVKIERRRFTAENCEPVQKTFRNVKIEGPSGVVFEQEGVEAPETWSDTAVSVVAQKYFRTVNGVRESSVNQMVQRVADTITVAGKEQGVLDAGTASVFHAELVQIILTQRASFNSPVWFNVGIEERPRASACFINSVDDDMESILDLAKIEGMIFKHGGGSGVNLSKLRGKNESLSRGGKASGPVSFMRGYDSFAGAIKSGGATRRAACIRVLDVDHPDIVDFVQCKVEVEEKAKSLMASGFGCGIDGDVYETLPFQNANHSVRVTDDFMEAAAQGKPWTLRARGVGESETVDAADLLGLVAKAAWACGDPGVQFDTETNRMHTCPEVGRINGSNPCSEFVFVDDSACNLASINLMKFVDGESGEFLIEDFQHTVEIMVLAMEIIVDLAGYPTKSIADNSRGLRPLGLGYTNLGAVLMSLGLPYDSDEAREFAAAVTALMHFRAACASVVLASHLGPFGMYQACSGSVKDVLQKHHDSLHVQQFHGAEAVKIADQARMDARAAVKNCQIHGIRNAQLTLLAPTGTISLMMDAETTGIEPLMAERTVKTMVGGGTVEQVPRCVNRCPNPEAIQTALGPDPLRWEAHVWMMASVQPYLSGAISKTVNLPSNASVADVRNVLETAWRAGLKAVAVYRDGCKGAQPVTVNDDVAESCQKSEPEIQCSLQCRKQLPPTRRSLTHKFNVGGTEGYVTTGMYEDGTPGEMFLSVAKEGSTLSGMLDAFAIAVSIGLQYGVPLDVLVDKFAHTRFEPSGWTSEKHIGYASSILDYVFRWIDTTFVEPEVRSEQRREGPPCPKCGSLMGRAGTCHTCPTCGETTGCG